MSIAEQSGRHDMTRVHRGLASTLRKTRRMLEIEAGARPAFIRVTVRASKTSWQGGKRPTLMREGRTYILHPTKGWRSA